MRAGLPEGEAAWTHCPQNLLEPILLDGARRESAACVVQGAECVSVDADDERVRVAEKSLETRTALLDQVEIQYQVGVVSKVEIAEGSTKSGLPVT